MNIWTMMVGLGILLILIGIYNLAPIKYQPGNAKIMKDFYGFLVQTIIITTFFIIMFYWCWKCGPLAMYIGLQESGIAASRFMPIMIALPFLIGFGVALAKVYDAQMRAGLHGKYWILWCLLAATLSPTSSAFAGMVTELNSDPALHWKLLYFLAIVPMMSLFILVLRSIGIGIELAGQTYLWNIGIVTGFSALVWSWSILKTR